MEEFTKAQDGVSKLSPLTEPNKGQRPSQQPESIAEMCSKAGILYRTRIEPNKEQRPSQQPESLMERLKNFSAACTNNEGQRPNLVKQEVQPRNEQEKWKLMMEPFVKDKTKNPPLGSSSSLFP